jgi:hypothetical protein
MIRKEDRVINIVRSQRHEVSKQFDHDVDRMIDYLIEMEKKFAEAGKYNFIGRASAKKKHITSRCSGRADARH